LTRSYWTVRLSDAAEADYDDILRWTVQRFGASQATRYGNLLAQTLARLERGPNIPGMRQRDAIGAGLRTLHAGRRGRHIILFRSGGERDRPVDVLRIFTRLDGSGAARAAGRLSGGGEVRVIYFA
jgi:toxin ParE1/3/4